MRRPFWLMLVFACTAQLASAAPEASKCSTVRVPAGWSEAVRIRLQLEDVRVPGDQLLTIRATGELEPGRQIALGTVELAGVARRTKQGRRVALLQLDVTRPLKQALAASPEAATCAVCATAVEAGDKAVPEAQWSFKAMRLQSE